MRRTTSLSAGGLLLAAFVAMAAAARADGTVVRAKGCGDKIFVLGTDGYSILTATGGDLPADGDTLTGQTDRIGHAVLFDRNTGRTLSVIVEDRRLDKSQATQRIAIACRSYLASNFTSGRVERATGCRNRILVNTAQGYSVLERLAGGIVADGDEVSGDFNKAGRATITEKRSGATLIVFVEDFRLSAGAASRKMAGYCR